VDEQTTRDRLETGLGHLTDAEPGFVKRERYFDGDQDLPYAPPGVNAEYLALREMSIANWIALASNAPVQRVRPNDFRITRDANADQATWDEVWGANNLDALWPIVATQMMNHSRGVMSVWRNPRERRSPIVRPENIRRVWLEPSIEDPFTQRVFTGFDPVMKDDEGKVIWQRDADGGVLLDAQGQPMPALVDMGRASVDRALVFPGADTRVFDLPESNLSNYIAALSAFLTDFFGRGQIPPQYLLDKMANLSGDALTGAESTLASLIADLKRWSGGSLKQVIRLAARARGEDLPTIGGEVNWADDEARSFAQIVDGIQKLISVGYPREAAFEMLPNMTPPRLRRIMDMVGAESQDPTLERIARDLIATAPPPVPPPGATGAVAAGV
jgi:hypothetical protein